MSEGARRNRAVRAPVCPDRGAAQAASVSVEEKNIAWLTAEVT